MWLPPFWTLVLTGITCVCYIHGQQKAARSYAFLTIFNKSLDCICRLVSRLSGKRSQVSFDYLVVLCLTRMGHLAPRSYLEFAHLFFFFLACPVLKVNACSFYFHRTDVRGHSIIRSLYPLLPFKSRLSEPFRNYHLPWKVSCSKRTEVVFLFPWSGCFKFGLFHLINKMLLTSLP